jgi:hypothetical protein
MGGKRQAAFGDEDHFYALEAQRKLASHELAGMMNREKHSS